MERIHVDLGPKSYDIEVARGSWSGMGKRIRSLSKADKVAVITDRRAAGTAADGAGL